MSISDSSLASSGSGTEVTLELPGDPSSSRVESAQPPLSQPPAHGYKIVFDNIDIFQ